MNQEKVDNIEEEKSQPINTLKLEPQPNNKENQRDKRTNWRKIWSSGSINGEGSN